MKNPTTIIIIRTPRIEQLIIIAKFKPPFVSSWGILSTIFIVKLMFKGGEPTKYSDLTTNM